MWQHLLRDRVTCHCQPWTTFPVRLNISTGLWGTSSSPAASTVTHLVYTDSWYWYSGLLKCCWWGDRVGAGVGSAARLFPRSWFPTGGFGSGSRGVLVLQGRGRQQILVPHSRAAGGKTHHIKNHHYGGVQFLAKQILRLLEWVFDWKKKNLNK